MKPKELKQLRQRLELTQQDMARALRVSFPTISRWENGHRKIPAEAARMLSSLEFLLDRANSEDSNLTIEEIREAVQAAGVSGVVSNAAVARLLPTARIATLAAIPHLAWLAGAVGIGVLGALPFFRKSLGDGGESKQRENIEEEADD